jgi:hypothetical protein
VQTGLLQGDLSATSVSEAAPDAVVTLAVDKGKIDGLKLDAQQAA